MVPSAVWMRWSVVPETTWAFVMISPLPTGNPLPVTSPPQPAPITLTVTPAAACTPGVLTSLGMGSAPGSAGSRVSKTGGNETPPGDACPRAGELGGPGATPARTGGTVQ